MEPYVKHSHIVPEFYLNHFANKEGKIFVFDKKEYSGFVSTPNKLLKIKDFYNIDEIKDPYNKQIIEHNLHELENETATVVESILSQLENRSFKGFGLDERKIISKYIMVQMKRTEGSIKRIEEVKKQSIEQVVDKVGKSKSSAYVEFINSTNSKDQFLFNLLTNFNEFSDLLCNRIWIIFKNKTNYSIYTSDHPANGHLHFQDTSSGYEICLPLSPIYILSIVFRKDFSELSNMNNKTFDLDKENMKFYNSLIFQSAERFILNNNNDFSFCKKLTKSLIST